MEINTNYFDSLYSNDTFIFLTINYLYPLIEVLVVLLPMLISVAYVTVAERKTMASMQRRLGPNIVGYYGLLQAFADALKLILKEYVSPTHANKVLFFLGPIITLNFSLLGYAVIPYGAGLSVSDFNIGILYMLAVSSLATYGILLAGWSANSKYSFLGSLRSTAQLISYELILSSAIILVIFFTGSLNLTTIIEFQKSIWLFFPLLPVSIIFFICALAETNRAPMDLAEAESELVSGFMTEHAAVIFVFFFLAEYASIVLISILTSILFLGGYLNINLNSILDWYYFLTPKSLYYSFTYYANGNYFIAGLYNYVFEIYNYILNSHIIHKINDFNTYSVNILSKYINIDFISRYSDVRGLSYKRIFQGNSLIYSDLLYHVKYYNNISNLNNNYIEDYKYCYYYLNSCYYIDFYYDYYFSSNNFNNLSVNGILTGLSMGLKAGSIVFLFIWVRASFPRIRYDQLMSFCWTVLLPLVVGFIIFIPCLLYSFDALVINNYVF